MRVVALIVVACGCRVVSPSGVDATTARGDGLPSRLVTDLALWSDVVTLDAGSRDTRIAADGSVSIEGARDGGAANDAAVETGSADLAPDAACALLGNTCVGLESCYPLPFDAEPNGATACAISGIWGPAMACQSQLDCDGTTLCSAPQKEADSVCLRRCNLADPVCPTGTHCAPFFAYAGVGVCL